MFWYAGPQSTGQGQGALSPSLRMEGVLVPAQWGCTRGPPPSCLSDPCSPVTHRLVVLLSFKIDREVDYADYIDILTSPEQTSHRTNHILSGNWQRLAEKSRFKLVTCLLLWISEGWEGKVFFWSSLGWALLLSFLSVLSPSTCSWYLLSVCLSLPHIHTHTHTQAFIHQGEVRRKEENSKLKSEKFFPLKFGRLEAGWWD